MNISLPITSTYAGLLSFVYLGLLFNVIRERYAHYVPLGDGTFELIKELSASSKKDGVAFDSRKYSKLLASIRSHGNFIEYVPLQLLLAGLLEIQGFNSKYLQIILLIFTIGRVSHAIGLSKHNHLGPGRPVGTISTILSISLTATANLYMGFK